VSKLQALDTSSAQFTYIVYEVVFNSRSVGITLENSRVYPEQIFVKDFTSTESPALESGAVAIGDILLGICSGKRHIRSTGELSELTTFVQASPRPIILRFVRDLNPPIDIDKISANLKMSAYWLRFLGGDNTSAASVAPSGHVSSSVVSSKREGSSATLDEDEEDRSDNPVVAWARFSLEVRQILSNDDCDEEGLAQIVEKHVIKQAFLASTWTEADAALSSWWHARRVCLFF